MTDFIDFCRSIKTRPSMFLWPVKYYSAVNLVIGYNYAVDSLLLEGFHEWLILKLGFRCEFYWGRLIPMIVFPETPDLLEEWREDKPSIEQEKMAIIRLADELEEFYQVKKDQNRGLRWIYAQYDLSCYKLDNE